MTPLRRPSRNRLLSGRVQPLITFVAVLCVTGSASVSGPPDVPSRVVRALGARVPALLVGRLEQSLPPESDLDLAAPPSLEELARVPDYCSPIRLDPAPARLHARGDYVDLGRRERPFPPRWRPR